MTGQCGYCVRGDGILVRVCVVSRGKPFESYAHKQCIKKWQKIADVRLADTGDRWEQLAAEDAKAYLENNRSDYYRQRYAEHIANGTNRCADCGQPISKDATYCLTHAAQRRGNGQPKLYASKAEYDKDRRQEANRQAQNKCIDCGMPISMWGKRCAKHARQHRNGL